MTVFASCVTLSPLVFMQAVNNDTFGPLIAYLVPGATVLLGFAQLSPTLRDWLATMPVDSPTIGGFLYLTVASIAVGMTVSAVRWAVVDTMHACTGLKLPPLDFARLTTNADAFGLLIEIHYRHYQFYANMFVATAVAYICYRVNLNGIWPLGWVDSGIAWLELVFFATSRDTLKKYYTRSQQLLATVEDQSPCSRLTAGPATVETEVSAPVGSQSPQESVRAPHIRSEVE